MTEQQMRQLVEEAGAVWLGLSCGLVMFQDPETKSTCAVYQRAVRDVDDITAALRRKREQFIEWWITPGGKKIPMSTVIVGRLATGDRAEMLQPHFTDCPNADDFRKR